MILHPEHVSLSLSIDTGIAVGWDLNLPTLPLILTFCAESDHGFITMCVYLYLTGLAQPRECDQI